MCLQHNAIIGSFDSILNIHQSCFHVNQVFTKLAKSGRVLSKNCKSLLVFYLKDVFFFNVHTYQMTVTAVTNISELTDLFTGLLWDHCLPCFPHTWRQYGISYFIRINWLNCARLSAVGRQKCGHPKMCSLSGYLEANVEMIWDSKLFWMVTHRL